MMREGTCIEDVIEGRAEWIVVRADCRFALGGIPPECIDACVCDPPYGLSKEPDIREVMRHWLNGDDYERRGRGFMGKKWDSFVPGPAYWDAVSRVLKPGAHLAAFGGTRTFDLMATAIRFSGLELRESLAWMYGCLSADTEALTRRGWISGTEITEDDELLQWDQGSDELSWTRPQRVIRKHWSGEMVNLKNRHTDQLLTPDHRVYARIVRHQRNGKGPIETVSASELRNHWNVDLPMAGRLRGGVDIDPDYAYLVGWWLTDAWAHKDGKACMFSQSKPETLDRLRRALAPYSPSEYVKEPRLPQHSAEHTFYVNGDIARKLLSEWPDREITWEVLSWGEEARARLIDGLLDGDGSRRTNRHGVVFWSKRSERRAIVTALFIASGWRAYEDPVKGCVQANPRPSTQVQKRHRDAAPPVPYDGIVWCVTVPTGAFVARRNGRPFITGNSGFPKSMSISLALDKADGIADQREVVHSYTASGNAGTSTKDKGGTYVTGAPNSDPVELSVTRGATEKSRKWDGFGTATKPAFEPIVMARKPIDGTIIGNVEKHGTGALNIDACRVPTDWDEPDRPDSWKASGYTADADAEKIAAPPGDGIQCHPGGRWPPNVLMDSEMAGVLAEQGGDRKSGGKNGLENERSQGVPMGIMKRNGDNHAHAGSSGTAARFFPIVDYDDKLDAPFYYCAKASTAEREAGLDAFPVRTAGQLTGRKEGSAGLTPRAGAGRASKGRRNLHTTVKPVALLSWLIRLVTPPGGIVIDPFCGSGSAGIAATLQGFRYIGIELDPDNEGHVEIARARIRHWLKHGGPVKQTAPPKNPKQQDLFA